MKNKKGVIILNNKYDQKTCIIDIETTDCNPWQGRIITIGAMDVDSKEIKVFHDENEEVLLMKFLQHFNANQYHQVIGYNLAYDKRYILGKCMKHRLPANAFYRATSTDLMMILKGFERSYNFNRPGTLNEWAQFLLGKGKLHFDVPVPILYQQERIQDIIEYNKNDLELTYEIWKRLNFILEA